MLKDIFQIQVSGSETKQFASLDANRDGFYERELNCQWLFSGDDGKILKLMFNSFNIESAQNDSYQNCFDYVEVGN